MSQPEITLVMIVRNESKVIERCLESVRPLLSGWVIVDTGSTDDTIEKIQRSLSDIPGELHPREWVDFGHNRNEALSLARGIGTHLLLIDADMTIRVLEIEIKTLRESRDMFQNRNAELMRTVKGLQAKQKKLD